MTRSREPRVAAHLVPSISSKPPLKTSSRDWQMIYVLLELYRATRQASLLQLAQRIGEFVRAGRYRLLETLAEETAAMVMDEFGVGWLRLRVGKPGAVANADEVGVEVERSRP